MLNTDKNVKVQYKEYYNYYKRSTLKPVSMGNFINILKSYNAACAEDMLEGGVLVLGPRLSYIRVLRREQHYKNPKINWNKTLKLKKELLAEGREIFNKETGKGDKYFVYHLEDDFFFRIYWSKKNCSAKNRSAYGFRPSISVRRGINNRHKADPTYASSIPLVKDK